MKFGEGVAAARVQQKPKHNKYNAIKTTFNGQVYDSKHEANYAVTLEKLKKAANLRDRVVKIERQVKFSFDYNGLDPKKPIHICSTVIDFKITFGDGRVEYHDPKGFKTRESAIKRKLMKAFYGIEVKFV